MDTGSQVDNCLSTLQAMLPFGISSEGADLKVCYISCDIR
jgi:hypothetical protein